MSDLRGVGVLVTRPEQQAAPLCRLLEASGARAFRMPVIDIHPIGDLSDIRRRLRLYEPLDLAICTSVNAVKFGLTLLDGKPSVPLGAIGMASARALAAEGRRATVTPVDGADSEGLLLHAALAHPMGQNFLIVKGSQGRELLQTQLTLRGANVLAAEVYKRERLEHGAVELAALAARFAGDDIHIVTATSADIANHLLDMATPVLRRALDRVLWLVPSSRVAQEVRGRGVKAPILQADSAEDQDLLAAIRRWRSSTSGA
jgi:uroporphyrinogen-III synthase